MDSAPWPHGNLCSDRVGGGLDARDHSIIVKYAIDLPLRRVAAAHFQPFVVTAVTSGLCLTVKTLLPELPGPALVIFTLLLLLSSLCVFVFLNQERVFGSQGIPALNRSRIGRR